MSTLSKDSELRKKLLDLEDPEEQIVDVVKSVSSRPMIRKKQQFSCCCCCCKCILIALLVVFLLGAAGIFYLWNGIAGVVQDFTIEVPHSQYPVGEMSPAEARLVQDRISTFFDEILAHQEPEEALVITQDEINGMLAQHEYLRGNIMVTFEEGVIREEYSLDVSMLPGGKGRYFVANDYMKIDNDSDEVEVMFETSAKHENWFDGPLLFARLQMLFDLEEEMLEVFLEKGSFFGNEADEDFIDEHINMMEDIYAHPDDHEDFVTLTRGIEKVKVEEGKLIISPRMASDDAE